MRKHLTIFIFLFLLALTAGISTILFYLSDGKANTQFGIESYPRRIVCINPAATEGIFALGCADRLVGVSDFCDYPPRVEKIARVGGVINPNLERIRSLRPDLVVVLGRSEKIANFCKKQGFAILRLDMQSVSAVLADIETLGEELGCSAEAAQLCSGIKNQLAQVRAIVARIEKPRVFLSLYRTPGSLTGISTAGANTLENELIVIAGGENIFGDIDEPYPKISKEALLKRRPEIIIEPLSHKAFSDRQRQKLLADWQLLPELPAVKQKRIDLPDADLVLKPGPRIGKIAAELAKIIHPEICRE